MHELALTKGVIDIVLSEQKRQGFGRVLEISLRIGEFSGIVPECIREFFPIAAAGSPARDAKLVIETVPASFLCLDCGHEGAADRKNACCMSCGSTAVKMTAGREFYVDSIKVE